MYREENDQRFDSTYTRISIYILKDRKERKTRKRNRRNGRRRPGASKLSLSSLKTTTTERLSRARLGKLLCSPESKRERESQGLVHSILGGRINTIAIQCVCLCGCALYREPCRRGAKDYHTHKHIFFSLLVALRYALAIFHASLLPCFFYHYFYYASFSYSLSFLYLRLFSFFGLNIQKVAQEQIKSSV